MFLTREHLTVNLATPALQVGTAAAAAYILGRLGHIVVSVIPAIALQGSVAALLSAVANNRFKDNTAYQYAALVASAAFSCVLLSGNRLNILANAKPFAIITTALITVRLVEEYVWPKVQEWRAA